MDAARFDSFVRLVATRASRPTRRGLVHGLAVLGFGGAGLLALPDAEAKKRRKKQTFCLNGQTIRASGKKKKRLRRNGATPGACPPPCVPSCVGKLCGDNGCGGSCGSCAADHACQGGVCVRKVHICGIGYKECATSSRTCCVAGHYCCPAGRGINGCCGIGTTCCPPSAKAPAGSCCPGGQTCDPVEGCK
jgi:hypothetical protein